MTGPRWETRTKVAGTQDSDSICSVNAEPPGNAQMPLTVKVIREESLLYLQRRKTQRETPTACHPICDIRAMVLHSGTGSLAAVVDRCVLVADDGGGGEILTANSFSGSTVPLRTGLE